MQHSTLQISFFLVLLLGIIVLSFLIFLPYLGALVLAAVFAVIFYPLYRHILHFVQERENIAAFVTTLCILVIIVLPFVFFGFQLFREARQVYLQVTDPTTIFSNQLIELVQARIQTVAPSISVNVDDYLQQSLEWLLQHTGSFFASTAKVVLNIFLSLLTLFYLLRDGYKLKRWMVDLSPLSELYDQHIVDRLRIAVHSVIKGSLMIAVTQGVVTGIGLAIFGVPNAVLWGSLTVLAALIPNIGTAAVLTPAITYLFLTDHLAAGMGLLIWGIIAVGLIDDFLGPRLINRDIHLHPMVILLAVIGGLHFFGPIGYILGPLVISLLFALLDIYPLLVLKKQSSEHTELHFTR
jgi:predicted PurR-regulated permease PerM